MYEVPTASKLFGGCSLGGNQATKSKLLQKMSKEFILNEYVNIHLYRFVEKKMPLIFDNAESELKVVSAVHDFHSG